MKPSLSVGYSTCPNDTLAFYALAHQKIDCRGFDFSIELADVEQLNRKASQGFLDISKLSFAFGNLTNLRTNEIVALGEAVA
jgi:1,4-dihydroxy-6-naphthoate synthase